MSQLTDNLSAIVAIKSDIKDAIEAKGVSMSGVSFGSYADKIGEIQTGGQFVTEPLSVSVNGTYTPGQGVDGFSQVVVDVPQSVTGFTEKELTEKTFTIINLNNSASYVASGAFTENYNLQTANLPNCTVVYNNAFGRCSSLSSVSLPNCTDIYNYAFQSCSSLTSVDLPKCETLYEGVFDRCYQLSSVSLPNCTDIYNYAFQSCSSLTSVDLPKCETLNNAFIRCSSLSSVSLPNCFQLGCDFEGTSVSYVELPMLGSVNNYFYFNSVVKAISICRDYAGCPVFTYNVNWGGLSSIYVPSELYDYFANSTRFSSFSSVLVSVPQSGSEPLISYSDGMIYGSARGINSTILGVVGVSKGDVTVLSFPNCERFDNNNGQIFNNGALTEINLPECKTMGMRFPGCTSLQRIYMPKLKNITNEAFSSCTSLSEIDFPSVEGINQYAFRGCTSLKVVKLSVCSNIRSTAFYGVGMMQSVYLYSNSVVDIGNYQNTVQAEKIYVPASLVDAYKTNIYWSRWSNNIYPIE